MSADTAVHERERPRWSAAEAARRCSVSRTTIQRALEAGRFPNASKDEGGWSIPLGDLLAAGFKPDRPAPPDTPVHAHGHPLHEGGQGHAHEHAQAEGVQVHPLHTRVRELEAELERERARAEHERALRAAAEHLAAVQAQRADDLRTALRMLDAARPAPPAAEEADPAPAPAPTPAHHFPPPRRRRTWAEWRADRRALREARSTSRAGS